MIASTSSKPCVRWMAGRRAQQGFAVGIEVASRASSGWTLGRSSETCAQPDIQSSRSSSPSRGAYLIGRPKRGRVKISPEILTEVEGEQHGLVSNYRSDGK